jgi:condensin complex subunit 3
MDILCKIANSERDLIRIVVDVVSELREGQGDEEIDAVRSSPFAVRNAESQPTQDTISLAGSPSRRRTIAGALADDPEQAVKKALVDYRALLICNSMLQRINSVCHPA